MFWNRRTARRRRSWRQLKRRRCSRTRSPDARMLCPSSRPGGGGDA
jgi:hypothetical protein